MTVRVSVVAVVHNHGWVLPVHLQSLAGQHLPEGVAMEFDYQSCGCTDGSTELLARFAAIAPLRAKVHADPSPSCSPAELVAVRARLRSAAIDRALDSGSDYVLFVEPTVQLPAEGLAMLLAADRPVVAGVLPVDRNFDLPPVHRNHNVYSLKVEATGTTRYLPLRGFPADLFPCDAVTHVYLARRDALRAGARPVFHPLGEDFGFCETVRAQGFSLSAHGAVPCRCASAPEELYLEAEALTAWFCAGGSIRLDQTASGIEVTVAPGLVASLLAESLSLRLAQKWPALDGWRPTGVDFDQPGPVARLRYVPGAKGGGR